MLTRGEWCQVAGNMPPNAFDRTLPDEIIELTYLNSDGGSGFIRLHGVAGPIAAGDVVLVSNFQTGEMLELGYGDRGWRLRNWDSAVSWAYAVGRGGFASRKAVFLPDGITVLDASDSLFAIGTNAVLGMGLMFCLPLAVFLGPFVPFMVAMAVMGIAMIFFNFRCWDRAAGEKPWREAPASWAYLAMIIYGVLAMVLSISGASFALRI